MEHLLLTPLHDQVLVKFEIPPRITKGGVHLPPNPQNDEYMRRGKVLAVGKNARDDDKEMQVEVGDRVYVPFNCGAEVERHYRNRHAETEGQVKLVKYKDIFGNVKTTTIEDKSPNVVHAIGIEELVAKADSKIIA